MARSSGSGGPSSASLVAGHLRPRLRAKSPPATVRCPSVRGLRISVVAAVTAAALAGCGAGDSTVAKTPEPITTAAPAPRPRPAPSAHSAAQTAEQSGIDRQPPPPRTTRARSTWPRPEIVKAVSDSAAATRAAVRAGTPSRVAGNYNECAQLSVVIVKANTNAANANTRARACSTSASSSRQACRTPTGSTASTTSASTGDTVALRYSSGVEGLASVVKFRWNGNGVELVANTALSWTLDVGRAPLQWQRVRRPTIIVIYSASDLAAAARCEYALLRSFDAQLGWGPPVAVGGRTARPHRQTRRRARTAPSRRAAGRRADESVVVIGRPAYTIAGLTAAAEQTMRAVERRRAGDLSGRDVRRPVRRFRRLPGASTATDYRLRDTKLARSVKVEALLQLAAYADALATAGVPVAPRSNWCSATAPPPATASTSCYLCTGGGEQHWSACSTHTWPAGPRCVGG